MEVTALDIPDVKLVTPKRFSDDRGFFSETYNARDFKAVGINCDFVQDNHSFSERKGTLRGLHYQAPPFEQAKLVRVLQGTILDVAVDARQSSATFGKWVSARLSAENGVQIFVPRGFLHGFLTLEPNTEIAYKVDNFYNSKSERAVRWDDLDLKIDWGLNIESITQSEKDRKADSWQSYQECCS